MFNKIPEKSKVALGVCGPFKQAFFKYVYIFFE